MTTNTHGATPGLDTSFQNDHSASEAIKVISGVTNDDFLTALTAAVTSVSGSAKLVVCKKPDNPEEGGWHAEACPCDTSDSTQNWYALPSLCDPDENGQFRAKKSLATQVFAVMLDDINTKVPLERLDTCPPTWLIETSPGNFQAGYIFSAPITAQQADELKIALIDADLCDKGATGGATRWMRLPVGINGKPKYGTPSFECKLYEWHPERRYSVDEIFDLLELVRPQWTGAPVGSLTGKDDVYTPRANENEVVSALKTKGLYKKPIGNGCHDITCPWVHEHTGQVDNGTAYFEPSDNYPVGGFKCHHGHGDKYRMSALLEHLDVTSSAARHKAIILHAAGELDRIVDAAERELAATKRFYQRGGLIVDVSENVETGDAEIRPLSQSALLRALSGVAIWMRYNKRSSTVEVIDPPARHVGVLFDSGAYIHLPTLNGIARQPHLRLDGTLVTSRGFDVATGLFGAFDPHRFSIPDRPTKEQAFEAWQELKPLLSEFEFGSPKDLSAAFSGILTAAIRPSLSTAPMIHVRAPVISSGKSFLCSLFVAFTGPVTSSAVSFPSNEEECQKLLLASLIASPGSIVFDNLTTDIVPYKSLCSALTEEKLTGRILGVSKTATVGTRVLFLSSGNNVAAVKDMARRCLTISLDPRVETPATRQFNGNPLVAVRADRERYVSLALTIIRARIVSDDPMEKVSPLSSYEQWSSWVRQAILWLGLPDPAFSIFEQLDQDPDREILGRMLHAWQSEFGTKPTMIREAVEKSERGRGDDLRDVIREVAEERGEINRRRLGKWIARKRGRVVDGMRFERASGTTSAERWFVQVVTASKSVTSVTSVRSISFEDNVADRRGSIGDAEKNLSLSDQHISPLH